MSIDFVKIKNYKSLKEVDIFLSNEFDSHCYFGKNGSGKSNFIDAIKYYFDLIDDNSLAQPIIDKQNPYSSKMEMDIVFNFARLQSIGSNQTIDQYKICLNKYMNKNHQISLKVTQFKEGKIEWFPNDKELRNIIKKVFPVYLIDTRFMDIIDWNTVWEIMSDLSKTNLKVSKEKFIEDYDKLLEDSYGEKVVKSLKAVTAKLTNEGLDINEYDYLNRYKSLLVSRLGGKDFLHKGNELDYYSDGMNSFKYIKTLLYLIPELAKLGWKYPIVLVDEIEIGLHPQFINELVDVLNLFESKYAGLLLTTHSPVFISGILKRGARAALYRVSADGFYTKIEKMSQFIENKNKGLLTMNEASYYFSDAVVIVEGMTEIQLFTHEKITKLYPVLSRIDFNSFDSNNSRLTNLLPNFNKFKIPYLLLVDMDKIIKCKSENGHFKFKYKSDKIINPLYSPSHKSKERNKFFVEKNGENNKHETYNLRQYIDKSLACLKFDILEDRHYIDDNHYSQIINHITFYCNKYNVYPVSTTVEGLIINEKSYDIVIDWLINLNVDLSFLINVLEKDKEWTKIKDKKYRCQILRLTFGGKFNSIQTLEEYNQIRPSAFKKDIDIVKKIISGSVGLKADGWMQVFIDYYFDNHLKFINESDKKTSFKNDFPELDKVIQIMINMIK